MCFSVAPSDGLGEANIYLALEIWEGMRCDEGHHPGTGRLEVLLPGYGLYWLRFEWPAGDG